MVRKRSRKDIATVSSTTRLQGKIFRYRTDIHYGVAFSLHSGMIIPRNINIKSRVVPVLDLEARYHEATIRIQLANLRMKPTTQNRIHDLNTVHLSLPQLWEATMRVFVPIFSLGDRVNLNIPNNVSSSIRCP